MGVEWDQKKNAADYAKHGIRFEVASQVFDDPLQRIFLIVWLTARSVGTRKEVYLIFRFL
jgi:uncharacterized DUF497 family protein